jgi:hypothetical protein
MVDDLTTYPVFSTAGNNELAVMGASTLERDGKIISADQGVVVGQYRSLEFIDEWIRKCRV